MRLCDVSGCDHKHWAGGLCSRHYQRKRRTGRTTISRAEKGEPMRWLEWAVAQETDECLPYPFATESGYGAVSYGGNKMAANRVVCLIAHGPAPTGAEAAHHCGNRPCCNKRHLRWASCAENQRDRLIHGTHKRGDRHPKARLTWGDVRAIRASSDLQVHLAERFGVSASHISGIKTGRFWKEGTTP